MMFILFFIRGRETHDLTHTQIKVLIIFIYIYSYLTWYTEHLFKLLIDLNDIMTSKEYLNYIPYCLQ